MDKMSAALFIRKVVFGFRTQGDFADALGYEQATISRFEAGQPFSSEAQKRIREYASRCGVPWDNNWFFDLPDDWQEHAEMGMARLADEDTPHSGGVCPLR